MQRLVITNKYFILRHGESRANRAGIIVSASDEASNGYGLTSNGKKEVFKNVEALMRAGIFNRVDRIITSPYLRTKESADIASTLLGVKVDCDEGLRERYFGDFDMTGDDNYSKVWSMDKIDPNHERWGVESVAAVCRRALDVVKEAENSAQGKTILLSTHGDVASALLTLFLGKKLGVHREVGKMRPGEIRALILSDS